MKKMFLVLALLIFASQAAAGTVTLTVVQDDNDLSARIADIYYAADANVSGFGLNITVDTADANIIDINNYFVGECSGSSKGFGIFPASFSREIDAGDPNWADPNYSPVAANTDAGASGTGLNTGTIIVEMGALYEDGNNPSLGGLLCKIQVDGDCNVTVTGDATRGNVVMEDASQASLNTTAATSVLIKGAPPCVYPACWDYLCQCHGDTDNNCIVNVDDFIVFKDSWNKIKDTHAAYDPCADFNRDGKVNVDDFIIFKDNWNKSVTADCTTGDINGVYCP